MGDYIMKNQLSLFIIFIFLLSYCSVNDSNEPINLEDSQLVLNILGKWSNDFYNISFSPNYFFNDTHYRHDPITQELKPIYSRTGNFEIINSILYLKTNEWTFHDSSFISRGISIVPNYSEIELTGDVLLKKSVIVLDNVEGNDTDIWGMWKYVIWSFHKSFSPENITYSGRQEYYYKFDKDSSNVAYGWKYLDGNPFNNPDFNSDFDYNPPILNLFGPGDYNLTVRFKYNQMYWYYDTPPIELFREL